MGLLIGFLFLLAMAGMVAAMALAFKAGTQDPETRKRISELESMREAMREADGSRGEPRWY